MWWGIGSFGDAEAFVRAVHVEGFAYVGFERVENRAVRVQEVTADPDHFDVLGVVVQQTGVGVRVVRPHHSNVGLEPGGEVADVHVECEGRGRMGGDHLEPVSWGDGVIKPLVVDLGRHAEFIEEVVAARRVPVHTQRDRDPVLQGQGNVGGLVVQDEVTLWGPDELGTDVTHILKLDRLKGRAVNDGGLSCQEPFVLEGLKLLA